MKYLICLFCVIILTNAAIDLAPKPDISKLVDLSELIEEDMKDKPYLYDTLGIPDDIDWHNLDLKTWKQPELFEQKLLDEVPELNTKEDHVIVDQNVGHEFPKIEL